MPLGFPTLIWFFTVLAAICNSTCGNEWPQEKKIDGIVQPLVDAEEIVGVVVGIVTPEGSHVLRYGSTSLSESTPPDGDTIFEIGSLTKVVTGVLLVRMVAGQSVELEDPVRKYLPGSVNVPTVNGKPMTLLHLATHTAGLPRDPANLRPKDPLNRFDGYSERQLYACLSGLGEDTFGKKTADGEHKSHSTYQYSNVGVGLLGHLLSRKGKKPFELLVREMIRDELQMADTCITLDDEQSKRLATGYYFYDQVAPSSSAGCIPGYGGFRSTVNDLLKFLAAHLRGGDSPIDPAIRLALQPHYDMDENSSVGLCWHIDRTTGTVWHGGTTTGFTSAMAFNSRSGFGVVVLTNSKSLVITPLVHALLGAAQGEMPQPIRPLTRIKVDEDVLDSYTGTYQDKSKPFLDALRSTRTIVREGDHLKVKGLNPTERFPLFPVTETGFICKGEDIYAKFRRNNDGEVLGIELILWGSKSQLTKLD